MSLRLRLVLGMVVVGLVLVVAAVIVTRTTEGHLTDRVDDQLRTAEPFRGDRGRGHGEPRGGGGGGGSGGEVSAGTFSALFVAEVSDDGGLSVLATPNLTADELPRPRIPAARLRGAAALGDGEERRFTVGSDGSDLRYRVLVKGPDPGRSALVLALPLDDVDAAVNRLVGVEVVATGLVIGLLALVTFWVLRLGVRPIKAMTATASAIAGGELSQRVPEADPHTEAGELGSALNGMLARIEEAFDQRSRSEDRLRRFVADASHELRTPVTTIRGYAELYRSGGLSRPDELSEAMRRTEQEAVRMGRLVDDLLLLARLDQGRPLEVAPVDLAELATDAVRDAKAVDPGRPITMSVDGAVPVRGDDERLRQVVANLLGNALQHTPRGTAVDVRAVRAGDRALLEVSDAGPGLDPAVAERVFERFYRADPSRSRQRGGTGLGLSIAQSIVEAHGGSITLDSRPGSGTTVRVGLPSA